MCIHVSSGSGGGHDQNVDPPASVVGKVFDDFGKPGASVFRAENHAAVDQHPPRCPVLLCQCDEEAIAELQRAIELSGDSAAFDSNLAYAYAASGRRDQALEIAKDLEARQTQGPAADANIALIHVGLGDNDQAMIWLNKAYQARFNPSILMRPVFDPLRPDPRFQDLLHRIGLPTRDAVIRR